MTWRSALAGATLILAAIQVSAARADEHITGFDAEIAVAADGAMTVTERIAVTAEGTQIRRGIFRDFPTSYRSPAGDVYRVGFEVLSVARDGRAEPFVLEPLSNGKRIKIGNSDVLLELGPHVYEISYRTTGQLGFFADHDELYWNVTGNGWVFPIDRAAARISLPDGARILSYDAYTGPAGTQGKAFRAASENDLTVRFETTELLQPGEGLTIVVAWPKGIVAEPSAAERTQRFLSQNGPVFAALAGLLGLLSYYSVTWIRVGRDPPAGTIIPLFEPPDALSPAAMRFVYRMGYDRKAFSAALINMAVKGFLQIQDNGSTFTLLRAGGTAMPLAQGEAKVGSLLLSGADRLAMDNKNHRIFGNAINALRESLEDEYERKVFVRNQIYFWIGVAITIAIAGVAALLSVDPAAVFFLTAFIAAAGGGGGYFLVTSWRKFITASSSFGDRIGNLFKALFSTLFIIPFAGVAIGIGSELTALVSLWTPALLAIAGILNIVFFELLKAPTLAGRQILDRIEGFKMYLETAEQHRLDLMHSPKDTPDLFERYLPYAIALDVENAWGERFKDVLEAAAADPTQKSGGYQPNWYSGSRFSRLSSASFGSALGSAIGSAAAAAATAPGSSSGSGGGGRSGGGGGGGGGGGW